MTPLERDFPELLETKPGRVEVFRLGDEPPEWVEWEHHTPQERLRAAELLRRIAFGYDPNTLCISRTVQVLDLRRR